MGKRKKVKNEIHYNLSLRKTLDKIKEIFKLKELKLMILLDEEPIHIHHKLIYRIKINAKFIGINENNDPFRTNEKEMLLEVHYNFSGKYFAKTEYLYSKANYQNEEQIKHLLDITITDYFHEIAYILYQMINQRYHQTGLIGYGLQSDLNINSMYCITQVYDIDIDSLDDLNVLFISLDSNLKFKDLLMNNNGEIMKNFMINKNKLIIIIDHEDNDAKKVS